MCITIMCINKQRYFCNKIWLKINKLKINLSSNSYYKDDGFLQMLNEDLKIVRKCKSKYP